MVIVLDAGHQHIVEVHQIDETHRFCHLIAEEKLRTSSEGFCEGLGDDAQVVLADFWDVDSEGVFVHERV